ncbi:MAG: LPXTG cell wall anchor domain-containing protein [Ilumatobacteraceae bacterium]
MQVKLSQLIMAAGITIASFAGFAASAEAAPPALPDVAACASGILSVVTDQDGVQHQACVDSAAGAAPVVRVESSARSSLLPQPTPTTGPSQLPKTGTGTSGLIIAAILVCSGCVASLVSRRKSESRQP